MEAVLKYRESCGGKISSASSLHGLEHDNHLFGVKLQSGDYDETERNCGRGGRGAFISPLVLDCCLVVGILALTLPGGFKMDHEI